MRGGISGVRIRYEEADLGRIGALYDQGRERFAETPTQVQYGRGKVGYAQLYAAASATPVNYEANVRAAYETFVEPGDIAVNVGAHSGKHTVPLARAVGATGFVYAFEPLEDAFARLTANLAADNLGDRVEAHQVAVSDRAVDQVEFFRVDRRLGQSGLKKRARYAKPEWRPIPTTTRVVTLDEVVQREGRVRFIKTDVEGAETAVFAGGTQLIEKHRPIVHFEFESPSYEAFDVDPSAMYGFFADRDYQLFDILGRRLPSVGEFLASDSAVGVYDYIAVPAEEPLADVMCSRLVAGWL